MIKFKNKDELSLNALMECNIYGCKEEAQKLWSTETNIVDVCIDHYNKLIAEDSKI